MIDHRIVSFWVMDSGQTEKLNLVVVTGVDPHFALMKELRCVNLERKRRMFTCQCISSSITKLDLRSSHEEKLHFGEKWKKQIFHPASGYHPVHSLPFPRH